MDVFVLLIKKINFLKLKICLSIKKNTYTDGMDNNNIWNIDVDGDGYLHDNDIVGDFDFDEPLNCNDLAATGERFPCDNCTCGFDKETVSNYVSKCGSCYLGDPYRCNGCPYLGKPPFNPNDETPL